ncbi:phosphatidylinositol N-acetylglucosaminyltransferase subunit H-like [Lineus longissimus]|uniref:phosphatidylinositol N-acetylglucosaminyltransferase subunit H-like n=1 Tax=Lineus longissimus TaxID=88925 RepID=UPI002B4E4CB1
MMADLALITRGSNGAADNGHVHGNNIEKLPGNNNNSMKHRRTQTKKPSDSEPAKSGKTFSYDSSGVLSKQSNFQEIIHDSDLCKEYIIRRGRTNLLLWIVFFIVFHVGALEYYFQLYTTDKRILFVLVAGILYFCGWTLNRKVIEESLLVISCLGVQITTKFASGRQTSIFFDRSEIKDIIIQESISMQCILHILSILLKKPNMDDHRLLPLFKHTFPRLEFLQQAYQGVQSVMDFNNQPAQDR